LQNIFQDSFDTYAGLLDNNYTLSYLLDYGSITFFLQVDTCETDYLTASSTNLFGFLPRFPLPEIQVVIVISTPAIISALVFISPIPSPAKPILPVSPPNISFPAISVNLILLSCRFRYYRDRYLRLLY
jgi:hypothetical protein